MERIKELDRYQKGLLVLLAVLAVAFCVIYSVVSSRVGVLYHDKILLPSEEKGNTVYSGFGTRRMRSPRTGNTPDAISAGP